MKAHEIFQQLPPGAGDEIFQHFYRNDRPAYRATLHLLASRRKLRDVVIERRPLAERHAWMSAELGRKSLADAAQEVLQTWLLGAHREMICEFLDSLGVPHDGQGLLESLPPQPDREKLRTAIDGLLSRNETTAAFAYLHLFAEMDITDWPDLRPLLAEDPRLAPSQNEASA